MIKPKALSSASFLSYAGCLALCVCSVGMGGALFACSPPPVRSAETNPLALAPPKPSSNSQPTTTPQRPKNVAVWAHIDQPDALLDITGLMNSSSFASEVSAYLELVDLHQPIDGVLLTSGGGMRDVEPAIRVHFKDSKAFFSLMSKEFQLREQGDRVIARARSASSPDGDPHSQQQGSKPPANGEASGGGGGGKDEWACDFVRGSDTAVCGTPAAVDVVADWLKTGPLPTPIAAPPSAAVARPAGGASLIGRLTAYTEPLHSLVGDIFGGRGGGSGGGSFLKDGDQISIDLTAEGDRLDLRGTLRLRSSESRVAKDLLTPPNASAAATTTSEAFARIWQESSGAAFMPGGGAMPKWIADVIRQSRDGLGTPAERARRDAAATVIGEAFAKPAAIGYGVRADRARAAIAAVRSSKDPNAAAAIQKLQDALEPQLMCALSVPIATLERAMRDFSSLAPPAPGSSSGSGSGAGKYSVRVASAKQALPKGSFFFEERTTDWSSAAQAHAMSTPPPNPSSPSAASGSAKPPPMPTHVSYMLFATSEVEGASFVWGVSCASEDVCVDTAKKLMVASNRPSGGSGNGNNNGDPLFQRPGTIVLGYVPVILGTTSMNRALLARGGPLPSNLLADIERDLAAPRAVVPFIITTTPNNVGDGAGGGLVTGELRGTRESFRNLADQGAFQGSYKIFTFLVTVFGNSGD